MQTSFNILVMLLHIIISFVIYSVDRKVED